LGEFIYAVTAAEGVILGEFVYAVTAGLRSETLPDHARVSFYLYCSLDLNKDRMTS